MSDIWRGTSGLYVIESVVNSMRYYGSARCLDSRWKEHVRDLRRNRHRNGHLQRAWDLYGEDAFTFRVLVVLEMGQLRSTEQRLLDCYYGDGCYNIALDASVPMAGRRHSSATREKMGQGKRGRVIAWADKISAARKGQLTEKQRAANTARRGVAVGARYTRSPEQRKAQSERAKQWYATATPEQRANVGRTGIKASAETRAKMSATRKGRKRSPESIAKQVASMRGTKKSPEHVAKMAANARAQWAARKAANN